MNAMKNLRFIAVIFSMAFFLIIFNSCKSGSGNIFDSEIAEIKFDELPDSVRLTDSFSQISCVQLELTENSILGKIKRIIDVDGELVVFGDNEIHVFNKDNGKFLRQIGSVGEGPGEFLRVEDIFYNPDEKEIVACEAARRELLRYKIDGNYAGKESADDCLGGMESIERASGGICLICNTLEDNNPNSYAFTCVRTNPTIAEIKRIEKFSPVYNDEGSYVWAHKPMSVFRDELRFVKFLGDTIFSIQNETISPLYKLDFGKKMLSKKEVSELGSLGDAYYSFCLRNDYLLHVDRMYETSRYISMFPVFEQYEGYYWIDKKEGTGYHISATPKYEDEIAKVASGKSILEIVGSNENGLISCYGAEVDSWCFKKVFAAMDWEEIVLPDSVVRAIENVDPEGNPFLIIYSH